MLILLGNKPYSESSDRGEKAVLSEERKRIPGSVSGSMPGESKHSVLSPFLGRFQPGIILNSMLNTGEATEVEDGRDSHGAQALP